jgi:hypothetical protein
MQVDMILPNLLILGGSHRNVGKTSLIIQLIQRMHQSHHVIGLKVSSIKGLDENMHGKHEKLASDFDIFEEKNRDGTKDTSRMLRAGAKNVFYIRAFDHAIPQAFSLFMNKIPKESCILCESISLRYFVQPGLFILIQEEHETKIKSSFQELKPRADLLIYTNGKTFNYDISKIDFRTETGWQTRQSY